MLKQGIISRKYTTNTTTTDDGASVATGVSDISLLGSAEQRNEVDLSRVVRMQLGQQSRRFIKARVGKQESMSTSTPQSLSIIYRPATNSTTTDKLVKTIKKSKGIPSVMDAAEDSLDLIIPSKDDFIALTRTLEDLLAFFKVEEPCANPDHAFIQYHLVDMGKSLVPGDHAGGGGCLVTCSEWATLCKRWNAPVTKAEATAMYNAFCQSLARPSTQSSGGGLEMFEVVRLLEVLRQRGMKTVGKGIGEKNLVIEDPRKILFQEVAQSMSGDCRAISAQDFLTFMHETQKMMNMSLQDVKELFHQLNGRRVSPQLDDALSIFTGYGTTKEGVTWEREYITSDAFGRYLLLESNDVFDPDRVCPNDGYMTEPLNNYWINTSHDTYLRRTTASSGAANSKQQLGKTDLQSYTLALYRGARAIELDVWDGPRGGGPVVCVGTSSFSEQHSIESKSSSSNSSLPFMDVILTISHFLQAEPNSLPIILLIENHCSLLFQEKMASDIAKILGNRNQLYAPNPATKDTDPLPSPAQLRGKVVIQSKLPLINKGVSEGFTLNDDFDDENRDMAPPSFTDYDSEDDMLENVVGFSSTGSIKSPDTQVLTTEELFQSARSQQLEASAAADAAYNQLLDTRHRAQQSQKHADALLRDINMTYDELKKKREETGTIPDEGTEIELSMDGAAKVKEPTDHAMEVAQAFAESVEESRLHAIAATIDARSEMELFDIAREDITDKEAALADAKEELQVVMMSNRELRENAERSLSLARINREYAENAERRVMAVKALLHKSHNQAVSSETVAGTADAEANISEQRARDTETRAKKARANAEAEKLKADRESQLEDDLETQLVKAQQKLNGSRNAVNAARERADDAVIQAGLLTDQISRSKSMGFSTDEDGSVGSHNKISKERKIHLGKMEQALTDKVGYESSTRKLENAIEDLQRKLNIQSKVASTARAQADHMMSIAFQLEEHALEEREAADLRLAARVNAKQGAETSDAVLTSTETQLEEAEKAAKEANEIALASRQEAERLSREAAAIQDTSHLEVNVTIVQESRDAAWLIYEAAKESKEEALERAARAKQMHETNCINLANLERDAMAELLYRESALQAELLAFNSCENAHAMLDEVEDLQKKYDDAKAVAEEKAGALIIAKRYKEKKKRMQPVSSSLAKLTTLHSCKHRNWDKSSTLPNHAMHSFPDAKAISKAEQGKEEWKLWVEFNKTHFSRVYPGSASRNYNPILPWAMGCQFVSMNFIRNKFILLNDGRFRENGGRGYVLKPEYLCSGKKGMNSTSRSSPLDCTNPREISIKILSGFGLPKSAEKSSTSTISPFVRVTMYDGSPGALLPSPVFKTNVVEGNGLNPVWNTKTSANFSCLNPSVAMILIGVYDHCNVTKTDYFIGASAIPVSCIREGYRSVVLFDSNNTRSGAMKYASLFIRVTSKTTSDFVEKSK